jgi:hypothetical protein
VRVAFTVPVGDDEVTQESGTGVLPVSQAQDARAT